MERKTKRQNRTKQKRERKWKKKKKKRGSPTHLLLFCMSLFSNTVLVQLTYLLPGGLYCWCCFWLFHSASPACPSFVPGWGVLQCDWLSGLLGSTWWRQEGLTSRTLAGFHLGLWIQSWQWRKGVTDLRASFHRSPGSLQQGRRSWSQGIFSCRLPGFWPLVGFYSCLNLLVIYCLPFSCLLGSILVIYV